MPLVRPMLALVSIPLEGDGAAEERASQERSPGVLSLTDYWNYDNQAVFTDWQLTFVTGSIIDINDPLGTSLIAGQFLEHGPYVIGFFRGTPHDAGNLKNYTCPPNPILRPMLALVSIPLEGAAPANEAESRTRRAAGPVAEALADGWNYDHQAVTSSSFGALEFFNGTMADPNSAQLIVGQYLRVSSTKRVVAFLRGTPNNAQDLAAAVC